MRRLGSDGRTEFQTLKPAGQLHRRRWRRRPEQHARSVGDRLSELLGTEIGLRRVVEIKLQTVVELAQAGTHHASLQLSCSCSLG